MRFRACSCSEGAVSVSVPNILERSVLIDARFVTQLDRAATLDKKTSTQVLCSDVTVHI